MPRDGEKVRRRLQDAGLMLFGDQGYERVTAAEIAAAAGVTQRTFFRHFFDKREILFDGETALSTLMTDAISHAPASLGAWATLFHAFKAVKPLLDDNRRFAEPRRRIIADSPQLREREMAKVGGMTAKIASALRARGISERRATLAAPIGMAAFGQAFTSWLDAGPSEFDDHLAQAFHDIRNLLSENGLAENEMRD